MDLVTDDDPAPQSRAPSTDNQAGTDPEAADRARNEALAPLVPRLAIELDESPGNVVRQIEGSMLSADISGFTALSERLASKGKAGAEEITVLINQCFKAIIDAAYRYHAEVLKFGGDAVLILFRGQDHLVRAGAAGIAMQEALRNSSTARRADLSMTVGIAEGPFYAFLVGDQRRELLIGGPNASEVIRLESTASKGATLTSPAIAKALTTRLTGADADNGGLVLADFTTPVRHDLGGDLRPHIPASVLDQFSAFSAMGGEHRLVSIGFVMLTGLDDLLAERDAAAVATILGDLINTVRDTCARYNVTFLHSDIAPNGAKLILAAGAPLTSGHDEDAILHAALAIAAHETPLTVRLGVQHGRVFAGFLGADYRKAYTVMGDAVNTAARLLGKAEDGHVVVTNDAFSATRTIFAGETIEPFMVKGKTEPLEAQRVLAATDDVRADPSRLPFVGRTAEVQQLTTRAQQGNGAIELVGPAGIGKTRTLDQLVPTVTGTTTLAASCTQHNALMPYAVFRPLLRRLLKIRPGSDGESSGQQLHAIVEKKAAALLPYLPLVATVVDADVAATPESDAIAPEFRRDLLNRSIVNLIEALVQGNILLTIEDAHWLDESSAELLTMLVSSEDRPRWMTVITRRAIGSFALPEGAEPRFLTHHLPPLGPASLRELAIGASTRPLSDLQIDAIVERSEGNPLFAIELAKAAGDISGDELPDSVEALLADRIDALDPDIRRLVRVASVFGTEVPRSSLASVVAGVDKKLSLASLDQVPDIISADSPTTLRFTQSLYRDAAYEGLPFRRRQRLHGQVGRQLEAEAGDEPENEAAALSHHYSLAGNQQQTWTYSGIAGDRARESAAHNQARLCYERALASSRRLSIDSKEMLSLLARLGETQMSLGDFEAAFTAFERARKHAELINDELYLRRLQGTARERQGRHSAALRWYTSALKVADETTEEDLRLEQSALSVACAGIRFRQGRHRDCWEWAQRAVEVAEAVGDRATLAYAYDLFQSSGTYLREPETPTYGRLALEEYATLGDQLGLSRVQNNLGVQAYFRGDWIDAVERYSAAQEAADKAGDVVLSGTAENNAAELLRDQGHFAAAVERLTNVVRNWEAADYATGAAVARQNLGTAQVWAGDIDTGRENLTVALERLTEMDAAWFIADTELRLVETDILSGNHDAAAQRLTRPAVTAAEDDTHRARRARLGAALAHHQGDPEAARTLAAEARAIAIAAAVDFEVAMADQLLGRLGAGEDHARNADEVFSRLGVVLTPDFLATPAG